MLLAASTIAGELLVASAVALMVLVNTGQLTHNVVARNLYVAHMDLSAYAPPAANNSASNDTFTPNLSLPLQEHNGVRREYYWGLYSVCGGDGTDGTLQCSSRRFGHYFDPLATIVADTVNVTALPSDWYTPSAPGKLPARSWLHRYSRIGFYFLFVGTTMTGCTFLAGLAAEGTFFLCSACAALLTGATLAVGAGMWTAVVSETRKTVHSRAAASLGIRIQFGPSLWMAWAATGAALAASIPFLLAFLLARRERRLYEERTYYYYDDDEGDYTYDRDKHQAASPVAASPSAASPSTASPSTASPSTASPSTASPLETKEEPQDDRYSAAAPRTHYARSPYEHGLQPPSSASSTLPSSPLPPFPPVDVQPPARASYVHPVSSGH